MAWSGYWYGRASGAYLGAYGKLGKPSLGLGPYLPDGTKKAVLAFRVVSGPDFSDIWRQYGLTNETWHFTVLRDATVHQHYGTQAVTTITGGPAGTWKTQRALEAMSVVVSFEPVRADVWVCRPGGARYVYIDSDLYESKPPKPGESCTYLGRGWGYCPSTKVQADAAVSLAKWLFQVSYKWGKPLKNINVFGADRWGEAIFEEPGPAPKQAIPWRKPVAGGSLGRGWDFYDPMYGCGGRHRALDIIGLDEGAPIIPAAGNHGGGGCRVVSRNSWDTYSSDMGYWVRLSHSEPWDYTDDGLPRIDTVYSHLMEPAYVNPNDWIDGNRIIGRVGQTGLAVGVHLHLGVYEFPNNAAYDSSGTSYTPYAACEYRKDPLKYLPSGAYQ